MSGESTLGVNINTELVIAVAQFIQFRIVQTKPNITGTLSIQVYPYYTIFFMALKYTTGLKLLALDRKNTATIHGTKHFKLESTSQHS